MVAVFTGNALGFQNSSLTQLGGGLTAQQGRDQQAVNLATGNLVVHGLDELLSVRGLAAGASRTYNSLGTFAATGSDGWLTGFEKRIELIGTLNQAGSLVRLHQGDGSQVDFLFTGAANVYRTTVGAGAHDTLTWTGDQPGSDFWVLEEGSSRRTERYLSLSGQPAAARLHEIEQSRHDGVDPARYQVSYDTEGRVIEVRAFSDAQPTGGDALLFTYNGAGQLTGLSTRESGVVREQVSFGYDAAGRLTVVEYDLTPDDIEELPAQDSWNATAAANDGLRFRTTYTYVDASSMRLAAIAHSDGRVTSYTYDAQGRVQTVTRGDTNTNDADGSGETLTLAYDTVAGRTDVTDSLGRTWSYYYDANGQLTAMHSPAQDGLRNVTAYQYDGDGNLTQVLTTRGAAVLSQADYAYDAAGSRTWEWDAVGNAVQRTYTATNQLATETIYTGVDPDRTGAALPTGGLTTRYVYDGQDRVRFVIGPDGHVTQFDYHASGNGKGQQSASRVYLEAYTGGDFTPATLEAWVLGRAGNSRLAELEYDARGNLSRRIDYAVVNGTSGAGVLNASAQVVRYIHDAQGLLRTQITVRAGDRLAAGAGNQAADSAVDYVYDGMGRLLDVVGRAGSSTFLNGLTDPATLADGATNLSRTTYLDSQAQVRVVSDSGVIRLETTDGAGRTVAVSESAPGAATRVGQNYFDAAGQLRASEDAAGGRSYFFYDASGQLIAEVDATGAAVAYRRDGLGRVTETLRFAERVDTSAWLQAGEVVVAALDEQGFDAQLVRRTTQSYDTAGRLVGQSDGQQTTVNTFDGAGRLVRSTTSAAGLSDRVNRYFYDEAGRLLASLDAAGYLVENHYDAAGSLVRTVRYATATPVAQREAGTLAQLRPVTNAADQAERVFHDGLGRETGRLNAEGYLVVILRDEIDNERATREYARQLTGLVGDESLATLTTLAMQSSPTPAYRETVRRFDALGRVSEELNHQGTLTRFHYDADGRLERTERAVATTEVRNGIQWFDAFGQLIGELGGEASAGLSPTATEAEKLAYFSQHGVRHNYDVLGRRIESIDAQGHRTWYFYDALGRQTFTVRGIADALGMPNAQAEVTETRYNAFGEAAETLAYTGRITIASPYGRDEAATALSALSFVASVDSRRTYSYDTRGLMVEQVNAEGSVTRMLYDGFGRMIESISAHGTAEAAVSRFGYDARGLRVSRAEAFGVAGLQRTTQQSFDAFGRVTGVIDALGHTVNLQYDRLGRQVGSTRLVGGRLESTASTYDAFGRVLTETNALGQTTSYAYDDVARSLTITSPEGVAVTRTHNRHGEAIAVLHPASGLTSFEFDRDGRLVKTTNALGQEEHREYDSRGQLLAVVSTGGTRTEFLYDAAGRTLRRIDDAGTGRLNLTTQYSYDGQGRALEVVAPDGTITQTQFDREGRAVAVVRDVGGLALRTEYTWDATGRQLTVTEGAGAAAARTMAYEYDALGRRIREVLDPGVGKLNIETLYAYDANDNLVARTNANGDTSYFAYDEAGRQVYAIDAVGAVTRTWHDEAGRVVAVRQYAEPLALSAADRAAIEFGASAVSHLAGRVVANDAADRLDYRVLDQEGRVRFTVGTQRVGADAIGSVQETRYDAAGRVAHQLAYGETVVLPASLVASLLQTGEQSGAAVAALLTELSSLVAGQLHTAQSSYTVYDALGRGRFIVHRASVSTTAPTGYVSERQFDAAGNVILERAFAAEIAYQPGQTEAALMAALAGAGDANSRETYYAYDRLGRLRFTVDDHGAMAEQRYDALGRVTHAIQYEYAIFGPVEKSESALAAATTGIEGARITQNHWDDAGRLVQVTDALGQSTLYSYDALGNRTAMTDRLGSRWDYAYDAAGRQIEEKSPAVAVVRYDNGVQVSALLRLATRIEYDALGNVVRRTENADAVNPADSRVTEYAYDARGNQIRVTFPDAGQLDEATGTIIATGVQPEVLTTYDALNRAVVQRDTLGHFSYKVYDQAGRVAFEVDAAGYVTEYEYDALGRQETLRRYAQPVNLTALAATGWSAGQAISLSQVQTAGVLVPTASDRLITTSYDLLGRKTVVEQASTVYWKADGTSATHSPRTEMAYNAYGDLVRESVLLEGLHSDTAARWAHTHHYYDEIGRRTLRVDAEGYVTAMAYDALGREVLRIEFAQSVGTDGLDTAQPPVLPEAGDFASGYDRSWLFTYDALGRKTSETVTRLYQTASGASAVRDVTTVIEYDAEGRSTAVIEDGVRTETAYDVLGRTVGIKESERLVLVSNWQSLLTSTGTSLDTAGLYALASPYTSMQYDAFGNVTTVIRHANGMQGGTVTPDAGDSRFETLYDWQGRSVMATDPTGHRVHTAYDLADRVVHTWHQLDMGTGGQVGVHSYHTYDALGRQVSTETTRTGLPGGTQTDAREAARYNAFGDIERKAATVSDLNSVGQYVGYSYDRAGNLVADNVGGAARTFRYNLAGHRLAETRSYSDDGAVSIAVNAFTLDRLGRTISTTLPSHSANQINASVSTQSLDRWGNVLELIDPRGNVTTWAYNERNQAIRQLAPRVLVVAADGTERWERPETRWMYDAAGRLIGIRDPNGHVDRFDFDPAGRMTRSIDALGYAATHAYDALGRLRVKQDPLGYLATQSYDKLDRVIANGDYLTSLDGLSRTAKTRESYVLNQRGDRVAVVNALGQTQKFDYDSRGLVLKSSSAAGVQMQYGYDSWGNKTLERNGLDHEMTWSYDVHGRVTGHQDMGGKIYAYTYQANGQLSGETSGWGLNKSVSYYPNGLVKRVQFSIGEYTEYEYDAAGNRVYERNVNTTLGVDVVTRASYDSHNRVSRVSSDDLAAGGVRFLDLEYAYDAVGNRRRVVAYSGYGPGITPLVPSNSAPAKINDIPSVNVKLGQGIEWRWHPGDYFMDPEGRELGFTVTKDSSSALPEWLSYRRDEVTGEWVFTYTGGGSEGLSANLQIKATDPAGATAVATFAVAIKQFNTAPVVQGSSAFSYLIKTGETFGQDYLLSDLFRDADLGDDLSLSLVGSTPPWLNVSATDDAILMSGTPQIGDAGVSTIFLKATDTSGSTASIAVTLDVKVPTAPTPYAVPGATAYAGGTFHFEREMSLVFVDPNADTFTVEASLADGSTLPYWLKFKVEDAGSGSSLVLSSNGIPTNIAHNSTVVVRFTATDSDGQSSSTTMTMNIVNLAQNQAPVYTPGTIGNQSMVAGTPWSFVVPSDAFVDPEGDTVSLSAAKLTWVEEPSPGPGEPGFAYWQMDPLPSWLTFNPTTRTFTGTPPSAQSFNVQLLATDQFGKSGSRTFLITVAANQAPYVSNPIPDGTVQAGSNWNYTIPSGTFVDPNGQSLNYSVSGLPAGMVFDPGARQFSFNNAVTGTYVLTVTANDGVGGTASDTFVLTVNAAPVVANPVPDQSASAGSAWSYVVPAGTFQDGNNHVLTYTASGMPSGMTFNAGTRSFSYASPVGGAYNITVTANDGYGGSVSDTFVLTVTAPANSPPVVASPIPDQSVQRSQTWSYTFAAGTFSDPNGHTLTYSASGMPSGMVFNAATRSFTYSAPYVTANVSHTITVTANDGHGATVSDSFVLTVLAGSGGGGPGGGGPGGGVQNSVSNETLMSARLASIENASETDLAIASSMDAPEVMQSTAGSMTGGLNREEAWFTYDAENRVAIVNGKLVNGQIVTEAPRMGRSSYLVQYDALGRESAQIYQSDLGLTIHRVDYTERGERLRSYYVTTAPVNPVSSTKYYDDAGRLIKSVAHFQSGQTLAVKDGEGNIVDVDIGGLLSEATLYSYDADGRLSSQKTYGRRANATFSIHDPEADQRYQWIQLIAPNGYVEDPVKQSTDLSALTLLEEVSYTTATGASGYDTAGRLHTYRYIKSASTWVGTSGYSTLANQTFTHTYNFSYQARSGYLETSVTGTSSNGNFKATTSTSLYDAAGRRSQVIDETPIPDSDDLESRRRFAYNADGQIVWRKDHYKDDNEWVQGKDEGSSKLQNIATRLISLEDWNALSKAEREAWYDRRDNHLMTYVSGQLVATQDQAGKLDVLGQLTGFSNTRLGRSQVQVQQGDTLRTIAARVYGNDQLWYVLADANGLGGDDALVAGSTLTVPEVKTSLNDASTFKPYDPGEITGPTTPSLPYIPPPDQGCGQIGALIMVVVAVVVSVVTYGAASSAMAAWQAGALAGAASSAAGQVVGNMTGVVDGFSFKDIALGAVTGAISAGVSSSLTGGKEGLKASTLFAKVGEKGTALTGLGRTVTGLASYAGSVAGNKLMGRSSGFSWAGIASTVVGASLSSALGGRIPFMEGGGASEGFWPDFGGGIINGVTTATVDRVFGLGRQNWASIVGSALGTAWGNSINSGPGVGRKTSAPEADRAVTFPHADAQRATVTELPQEAMGGVSGAPQKATAVRSPVAEEVDLSGIDTSDILATLSTVHVTGDERRDSLFMNYWMWSQATGYRAPNATEDLKAYYRKADAWVANDPRTVRYNAWSSQSLAAVYASNGISFNTSIGPPNPYLARYNAINGAIASVFEKAEAPFIALQNVSHEARMNARAWVMESDSSPEALFKSGFYAFATFGDGLIQAGAGTGRLIANPPQSAAGIYSALSDPGAVWDAIVDMPLEEKLVAGGTAIATGGAGLLRRIQNPRLTAAPGAVNRTGTIWDSIRSSGDVHPGSVIPRQFELTLGNGQKIWVDGNATKHIAEYAAGKARYATPEAVRLSSQVQLESLSAAVNTANANGIVYRQMIKVDGWELIFAPPRSAGEFPALYHALYKAK